MLTLLIIPRTFKFDVYISNNQQKPPKRLTSQLAGQLGRMTGLEKLVLVIPEYHTDIFASEFISRNMSLPGVNTLAVGPFCDFALQTCPNVQTVSGNGYQWMNSKRADIFNRENTLALINAAGNAANVMNLEIMERWDVPLVQAILEALPDLPNLTLDGGIYSAPIADFVPVLSQFAKLKRLAVTDAMGLGVGFDPPWCGNAYFDEDGNIDTEFVASIDAEREEAEAKVLAMIAPACRNLTEFWVGEHSKADIRRDAAGDFMNAVWHRGEFIDKVVYYPRP